jgi:hypothetical protein
MTLPIIRWLNIYLMATSQANELDRYAAASDRGSQASDIPYPIRNHVGEEVLYNSARRSLLVNVIDGAETSRQSAMGAQRI